MSARAIDRERVRQKVQFIRDRSRHLRDIQAAGLERFLSEDVLQAAAVRNLQVMIEAMLDIVHHIVAQEGLGVPGTYHEALDLVLRHGFLEEPQGPVLHGMIGFRNRAVHLYDQLDPRRVFSLVESQSRDFETFLASIVKRYLAD